MYWSYGGTLSYIGLSIKFIDDALEFANGFVIYACYFSKDLPLLRLFAI